MVCLLMDRGLPTSTGRLKAYGVLDSRLCCRVVFCRQLCVVTIWVSGFRIVLKTSWI